MWRNDEKCGNYYNLPDGTAAQCDPDGENPCCSDGWDGECGNTTEHCSCSSCTDYKFVKWWRESGGTQMWRNDGKCGDGYPLPNGSAAQCDPEGENPCCSDGWDGECGNTAEHCSCSSCTDYKFVKWWRESGGTQMWRNDGKCGDGYPLPNSSAAQCDPDGENPCCSDRWDGECGNTIEHCSCSSCTDYKFVKWWRESGGTQMWRNDGKCGDGYPLPNGSAAQCDPDGENPCCSDGWDGECGNTTEHCSCSSCTDYKFVKWWGESGGTQMWRNDGKCGDGYSLPNGSAAQCDPDGENRCCSNGYWNGECGNTTKHCSCRDCTDYNMIYKDWRESEGTQMWRYDGKCGENFPLPNGIAAQCDPDGENPCCSDRYWNGECGNTTEQCSCSSCTDYKFVKWWRESGGTQMWRNDGKCGDGYPLPNGSAAQCDPEGENPCCSDGWDGECGNKTEHCSCSSCTDYKFVNWWRESGGTQMWRNDGKCGDDYPLPNGTAAQCDPEGENPCCSERWDGECGNTIEHCSCSSCTDYKFAKEWRESGGTQMWRNDGKCGSDNPLPNGTAAQCDPEGENPCCDNRWDGECGNTTEHCSCDYCTDYKDFIDWRESGGTQMWRNDGKCGDDYPLPNGTAAQCNPDGKNPCCSRSESECGNTTKLCFCEDCVNYNLEKQFQKSKSECTYVRLPNGFLKFGCYNETAQKMKYKCAYSDVFYEVRYTKSSDYSPLSVSEVCKNDLYVYQACGFSNNILIGTEVLCGGYFCRSNNPDSINYDFIECQGDNCVKENRVCDSKLDESLLCDDKCDEISCKDESYCNGFKYGANCDLRYTDYLPPDEVCYLSEEDNSLCLDKSDRDKLHCDDLDNTTTCTHYRRQVDDYHKEFAVPILNYTRCSIFDFNQYTYPYCLDYLDQTNCSDIERVGGYCAINGFNSSVSKYVLCYDYDTKINIPVKICDDDMQNKCLYPSTSDCQVHKHLMCDGVKDCLDGTDEFHDMCETMTDESSFTNCTRRFNSKKPSMNIPLSWIRDNEIDCMNGEDEDSNQWQLCPGDFRRVLVDGEKCKDAYKCPDGKQLSK